MVGSEQLAQYERDGFLVVKHLFSEAEAIQLREHYMALRQQGEKPGDFSGVNAEEVDPLKLYPRMIQLM